MLEKKEQLWSWLGEGAVFYVCGDASRMAKDVDQALRTIAHEEGSLSEEDASAWVKNLQKKSVTLRMFINPEV